MYFDVKKTWLSNHRLNKYVCVLKNNEGMTIKIKKTKTEQEAWEWGKSQLINVRR